MPPRISTLLSVSQRLEMVVGLESSQDLQLPGPAWLCRALGARS